MQNIFIKNKVFFLQIFVVLFVIFVDQITKYFAVNFFHSICEDIYSYCSYTILSFFNFTFVCNKGVSFGMLSKIAYSDVILSISAILILVFFIRYLIKSKNNFEKLAILFIIGGAIGNLIDRINQSCVTDFLHFYYHDYHFPVFNIADCFVTLGGILLVLYEMKSFLNKKVKKL